MEIKRKTEEFIAMIQSYHQEEDVGERDYGKLTTLFKDDSFRLYAEKTHQAIAVYNFLENRYTYISAGVKQYCPDFDPAIPESGPDLFIGMMKPSSIDAMVNTITPRMLETSLNNKENITSLKFTACVEINPSSNINWVMVQTYLLNATPEGFPTLSCTMVSDVTPIKKDSSIYYSAHIIQKENLELLYAETIGNVSQLNSLSRRELEVLNLVSKGKTTKEIADVLFISFETAKKHRSNILEKMNCVNTAELLNRATVMGVI